MPKHSPISQWNFLQVDNRLRGAIAHRIGQIGTTREEVSKTLGLNRYKVKDYLISKTPNLNNYEIIKLANGLGIEVELEVRFKDVAGGAIL